MDRCRPSSWDILGSMTSNKLQQQKNERGVGPPSQYDISRQVKPAKHRDGNETEPIQWSINRTRIQGLRYSGYI